MSIKFLFDETGKKQFYEQKPANHSYTTNKINLWSIKFVIFKNFL